MPDPPFHPIELELPYKSCHPSLLQSGPELASDIPDLSFTSKFYDVTLIRLATLAKDERKSIDAATEPNFSDRKRNQYRSTTKY
jgi:hypothetical protein